MATEIEICNLAIGHVRGSSIQSLNEATNEARYCKLYYHPARKFVLENHPWKCANKIAPLALLEETPHEWLYSYGYPSDALSIRRILPSEVAIDNYDRMRLYQLEYFGTNLEKVMNDPIQYEIGINSDGSQVIWTNQESAYAAYTLNQTVATLFPSAVVTGIAHYLASLIAVPIAGRDEGREIMKDQLALYDVTMKAAEANNMFERFKMQQRESDMITVRG